ncbi:phosphatase PAP2 family protein [Dactylosporangium vinaceum]|uniref:Phosphatase PAP2 family protein n=1 Tax=Dactylosporangium vinaceum TaxID=53362 RepID=A0ABV5M2F2_9ACTN|nr:phosphatase PAP2 family protein [Dactylosporangium vinaceum]UAB96224.1 phosphatase PAP2 family protein [Dactylosporangium vinaceum]
MHNNLLGRAVPTATAVLFVVLTGLVTMRSAPLVRLDTHVSDAAHALALGHPAWRAAMSAVTHTADSAVIWVLALLALLVLLARRDRSAIVLLVATAAAATVVRHGVLWLVHRPRPADRLTAASGFSYPSGHTTSSAVAAGLVIVLGWRLLPNRWSRLTLAGVAGGWAVLVGVSRVALVAHWPTDVIGGWLLATTVIVTATLLWRRPAGVQGDASPPNDPG